MGRKRQRRGTSPHLLGVAGTGKHRRILGVLRARPAPKVGVAGGRGVRWGTVRGIEGALPTGALPGLISEALSTWIQARGTESKPPSYPAPPRPGGPRSCTRRGARPGRTGAGRDRAVPRRHPGAPGRHPPRPQTLGAAPLGAGCAPNQARRPTPPARGGRSGRGASLSAALASAGGQSGGRRTGGPAPRAERGARPGEGGLRARRGELPRKRARCRAGDKARSLLTAPRERRWKIPGEEAAERGQGTMPRTLLLRTPLPPDTHTP